MTTQATTALPARAYETAADFYLGWLNAQVATSERVARVTRVWLEEALGVQQDMVDTARRAVEESRTLLTPVADEEFPTLTGAYSRFGDLARSTTVLWTEAGLKARDRYGRVAQTALDELQAAQSDFSASAEQTIERIMRGADVVEAK